MSNNDPLTADIPPGPEPPYDPDSTPDTLFGLFMLGLNIEEVAKNLGISLETLWRWIEEHDELRKANAKVVRADAMVLAGVHKLASGHTGTDKKYYPPNLPAAKWWVQWRKVGPRTAPEKPSRELSDDERNRIAARVIDKISNQLPETIKQRDNK